MGFFNSLKNFFIPETADTASERLRQWLGIDDDITTPKTLAETTYFTCLKVLSETMGKMPLKLCRGSPPHTRGTRKSPSFLLSYIRITPAYAGNTCGCASIQAKQRDDSVNFLVDYGGKLSALWQCLCVDTKGLQQWLKDRQDTNKSLLDYEI